MLSVVEQRAGLWGALSAGTLASATAHVTASANDQHGGVSFAANVGGDVSADQHPVVDSSSHDLPSVSFSMAVIFPPPILSTDRLSDTHLSDNLGLL